MQGQSCFIRIETLETFILKLKPVVWDLFEFCFYVRKESESCFLLRGRELVEFCLRSWNWKMHS